MIQKVQENKEIIGQLPDSDNKCICQRCGKRLAQVNFFTHRDKSKFTLCKPCLTAHIDNNNPQTFLWILELADVPYVPHEWKAILDAAFMKNPKKINGMSVIGKYLAKMRLNQYGKKRYKDSEQLQKEYEEKLAKEEQNRKIEQQTYEANLKVQLSEGKISEAEYKTLVSAETQMKQMPTVQGNVITGEYNNIIGQYKNPFQEQNFLSQDELIDPGADLNRQDKIYLALKWGRLYTPAQWVSLEKLYTQFMKSFDIQGAARIDTLKMICKTSLKMNEAIDSGDVDSYQKLSRVYDSMMKSAKFTEAQNKDKEGQGIDSASAIVDFVQAHSGSIPRYDCSEPQDIVDQIILDLKTYTKNLIYEDKSLAQEIEQYLQNKKNSEEMKKDRKQAKEKGLQNLELEDNDFIEYKQMLADMKSLDESLKDEDIELEYQNRRVQV